MKKKKEAPKEAEAPEVVQEAAPEGTEAAPEAQEPEPVDPFADLVYPCIALVRKYADAVPVEVSNRAHLARLITEHGGSCVEVQKQ